MPRAILVVDDDAHIREVLEFALAREGYGVASCGSGEEALRRVKAGRVDLVVLDLNLPGIDGLEVCRRLRALPSAVPVLMLTCRDEEVDRVLGLETGADDYVAKPFAKRELLARVKALLRRVDLDVAGASGGPRYRWRGLTLDAGAFRADWNGSPLRFTPSEFGVLKALLARPEAVLAREDLLDALDPDDLEASDRSVDTHVKRIRAKLRAHGEAADPIETVYGMGYRLRAE
jgi:two-component system OmpR family response regulator